MRERGLIRGRGSQDAATIRLSLTLEQSQAEKVQAIADEMQVSAAWVIRRAIDNYLAAYLKIPPQRPPAPDE
jgi:hypothetical protein